MSVDKMEIVEAWKTVCGTTDGCSTGVLKPLTRWWLNCIGKPRNYNYLCVQHDMDYRYPHYFDLTRKQADIYLSNGISAAGHPLIAKAVYAGLWLGGWRAWRNHRKND